MAMGETRRGLALGPVLRVVIAVGGMATCVTLLFLGMRAVMDVGGMCAEGGPYQIRQTCPQGSPTAMVLGILGLFLFGGIGMWGGSQLGGAWQGIPVLAWSGLFGALGWNFLDYGILNPPPKAGGIVWGWLVPGIMFELMAFVPILLGLWVMRTASWQGPRPRAGRLTVPRPDPGRARPAVRHSTRPVPRTPEEAQAAIAEATGTPIPGSVVGPPAAGGGEFPESRQALLDRLERLADLRDRGLLRPDEYEAAKEVVMHELESRS